VFQDNASINSPVVHINAPGSWDFFLSHTQRDGEAKLLAEVLFSGLKERGHCPWLDVKMDSCDGAAMEEGVRGSACFVAVVTDSGKKDESYFSRWMCREEIKWAMEAGKAIVPVIAAADKLRVGARPFLHDAPISVPPLSFRDSRHCAGDFIADAKTYGIDFGSHNFVHIDRSGPEYLAASVQTLLKNATAKGAVFNGR
jgi:hypothetical protein